MKSSNYAAGLHFVNRFAETSIDHDRSAIWKHARKAHAKRPRKKPVGLRSWISPDREPGSSSMALPDQEPTSRSTSSLSPRLVGSNFSGLQLPEGVEPQMIQDLVQYIVVGRHVAYPYEICLNVHQLETGWFPYMISDLCCLHSMMFSLRAFTERYSHEKPSHFTSFHYAQTLRILQSRLYDLDYTSAISDATIMVVITLASIAEITNDFAGVELHVKGLEKIVSLRGGVRALKTHNNMQVKVCRADLAYALLFGRQPLLLRGEISWDCFIAEGGLIKCSHQPHEVSVRTFAERNLDTPLNNIMKDVHAFSCMSNVAYQTTRKLSPELYNEITISILYRLTHLSFEGDVVQEAIRTGLLVFLSTIFFQRYAIDQPYDHLLNLYNNTLTKLFASNDIEVPAPLVLWLTMLSHMASREESFQQQHDDIRLDKVIAQGGIGSWLQAREILRSVAWVDFVHERVGQEIFEKAQFRISNLKPILERNLVD